MTQLEPGTDEPVRRQRRRANVPTFYQYLVRGGILLLTVLFDRWKNGRRPELKR